MRWEQLSEKLDYADLEDIPDEYKDIVINYIDEGYYLYRGMRPSAKVIVGDGNSTERKSRNTTNFYTVFIDHFDSDWSAYPKRSKSFICTTSSAIANGYGTIFAAVPLEGQAIGICPEYDFWDAFSAMKNLMGIDALDSFNEIMDDLLFRTIKADTPETPSDFETVMGKFEEFVNATSIEEFEAMGAKGWYTKPEATKFFKMCKKGGVINAMKALFDPAANGFHVDSYVNTSKFPKNEVWMTGKVLFIEYKLFRKLVDQYL